MPEPPDFDAWLKLKGHDRARLHPREREFLRACWEAECVLAPAAAARLTAPAACAIRAGATAPAPFRIESAGACTIAAEAGEGKLATFEGVAYTGAPMKPEGWWQSIVVDLDGVKVPSQHRPILRQHDAEQILGHSTSVKADKDGIHVSGVFSGEPAHVQKVTLPAKNGFQWQLSIGANPTRTEYVEPGETATVNGREVTGPLTIARETVIGEISFVPLGADGDTSAVVHAQQGRAVNVFKAMLKQLKAGTGKAALAARKYSDEDVDKMSDDDAKKNFKKCMAEEEEDVDAAGKSKAKASDEDDDEDDKKAEAARKTRLAASRKEEADELRRCDAIKAMGKKYPKLECEFEHDGKKIRANVVNHAIEHGMTVPEAEIILLRNDRPGPGVGLPGGLGYSASSPQLSEAVLEAAVLQAARHQYRLEHDDFWTEPTPDGKGAQRRAGLNHLEAETRREIKARYTDQVQQQAHDLYKGRIGLHQLIRAGFQSWGQGERQFDLKSQGGIRAMLQAWDQHEIRAEGASNLSISNVLANVLNKFALQGYLFVEQAWREIAGIRPVSDFKPSKSINLLGDVMYRQVGSSGELQNASLGDQAFANQANVFGRIITLPWQHIVNDDLGMLTGAPMKIGQGAGLALNDYFWSLWSALTSGSVANAGSAGNPNGAIPSGYTLTADDGNAFWRTTSSNTAAVRKAGTAYLPNKATGAGTVLATAGLQQAKALFDNQIDPNGNPLGFNGATPVLLHGPTLWQTVNQLLYGSILIATGLSSTSAAAVQPSNNVWAGAARPVMSRYVESASYVNSTTAWWLLMNPAALPVIEVAFLNGQDTPAVLTAGPDYQFDRLGISIRGTMPFGVNQQQFRGGVYMAGA